MTSYILYCEFEASDDDIDAIGDAILAALPQGSIVELEPAEVQNVHILGEAL